MEPREGLRLAIVPAFFGFGALWPQDIQGADSLVELLMPLDRHPVLERLERNRVEHLLHGHAMRMRVFELEDRLRQQEDLLRQMLDSRAFTIAEYVSRAYQRGEPMFSRERLRRALDDQP